MTGKGLPPPLLPDHALRASRRVGVSMSVHVLAHIDARARLAGLTRGQWLQFAAIEQIHRDDKEAHIQAQMREIFPK